MATAPLLRAHGLPATVFLMTSKVGDPSEFWSDALERIVTSTTVEALAVQTPEGELRVDLGPVDPPEIARRWNGLETPRTRRQAAYLTLWRTLRDFPSEAQAAALASLHRQSGTPEAARASHRAVTAAEAAALARDPLIEIGAHSVTHARLSALSPEAQLHEIRASREACADLVGFPPTSFAYPYGDYAPETVELVAQAGFAIACTTQGGAVSPAHGPLTLPRAPVGDWDARRFTAALGAQTL
jgi:peptidoglycan/xylan/chitin deacetylase (PgdA/CDA1 family)